MNSSYLVHGSAADHTLRVLAADTTQLVEEARRRHGTSATATAALGRSLTGTLLLARTLNKGAEDRLTLRVQGDGPLGWIIAEGSVDGKARGYVKYPEADLPARASDGKLDVGALVGKNGDLAVTRLLENSEPYTGSVELVSGEIAEDVAAYLRKSEQIGNAVLLGVHLNDRGVTAAGGAIIQAMPGVSDATLARVEANVRSVGQITSAMTDGGILAVVERLTAGLGLELNEEAVSLEFRCRCSVQRALGAIAYFDHAEREDMIRSGGQEVVCHWCGHHYQITPEEIRSLSASL